MKIERIVTTRIALPLRRPHRLAMATLTDHDMLIVQLFTDEGIAGLGEVSIIPHYGAETPGTVQHIIDACLVPALAGADPRNLMQIHARMDAAIPGHAYAKAALEMACLDCAGRALGVSVATLLGGALRQRMPALWVLGHGEARRDIEEAQSLLESRSHRLFLVKVGKGEPAENVRRALDIKQALGEHASVRVDANQGWDEATASWCIERLEAGGIDAVEQPVPAWNRAAMQRLAARFTVPIMADEAVCTLQDAMAFAGEAAADAFSIKVSKHGGLMRARQVATVAEAAGISLFGGTMLEGGIGTSACAQLFATLPSLAWGCQLFGPRLLKDDVACAPVSYDAFDLVLGDSVGLGLEIDPDKLRFYQVPR
ncbi:chloromuconate cycloisomerase [Bordetella trematum]|uniref:Chloromuconate cycloisomerase n=1 Tax=Bordetella trematum TaxID=123899 RepID=A0A157SN20_9BORD|nr:muconate/chloromuconate family cycloisomerase [Bordetella trematum]NNH17416.1 muconate cycloisomerase [Bordetella trematum]SAI59796.1 chloromuconate cycloisomerase [Bordetella trematum]SAI71694.1 chloromuconate cycloisomerase [Bordetella trematum]SUV98145.1 chloromuconate cycloisomerase [Bordetella trematum]